MTTVRLTIIGLVVAVLAAVAARLVLGGIPAGEVAGEILQLRALRAVTGLAVGGCLGVSGVLMQALLRNPLASPDIMGVSAGASFAVMLAIFVGGLVGANPEAAADGVAAFGGAEGGVGRAGMRLGSWDGWGMWRAGPALVGGLGTLALLYRLSRRREGIDPNWLVLIGVVLGVMCGAGVMLIQHLMPDGGAAAGGLRVLVGSLTDEAQPWHAGIGLVLAILGAYMGVRLAPAMDAASLGDDTATSVGVSMGRLRALLLVTSGVLAAVAVALAGPIGFVGLIGPHIVRRLLASRGGVSAGYGQLVVGSALAGAILIVAGDGLARVLSTESGRLPLGVLMALLGGPVLIWVLVREQGR